MADSVGGLPPGTEMRRWVQLTQRLDASASRVFRAWSDPEELARWWPDRVEGGLAVATRTVLVWEHTRRWWDIVEVEPPRTLAFRHGWPPDDWLVTTVRITVASIGYGSGLDLTDGPFPLDEPGGLDAWAAAIQLWTEALTMLRAQVDFSVDVRGR